MLRSCASSEGLRPGVLKTYSSDDSLSEAERPPGTGMTVSCERLRGSWYRPLGSVAKGSVGPCREGGESYKAAADDADEGCECEGKKPLTDVCLADEQAVGGVRCSGRLSLQSGSEDVDLEQSP